MSYFSSKSFISREVILSAGTTVNFSGGTNPLEIPANCHTLICYTNSPNIGIPVEVGFAETASIFEGSTNYSEFGVQLINFNNVVIPLGNAEQNNGSRVFWIRNSSALTRAVYILLLMSNGKLDRNQDYSIAFPQKYS